MGSFEVGIECGDGGVPGELFHVNQMSLRQS